ncbi:fimbrillin family protein [Bacteroides sp. 224]|uniref:fimbrillin family protein n=1 Tax=Bacteroides sp. 224 TaxID=2302936 RepID=UPI0013D57FC5|nr:fimbrillin family protein [Bacteroides sp. 224]NDV65608.1 fimbrillin family protein [Bacteroides sp. 224]
MRKLFLLAATATFIMSSCSSDQDLDVNLSNSTGEKEIGFRTLTEKSSNTRTVITNGDNMLSFTLTGWWDKDGATPDYGNPDAESGVYMFNGIDISRGENQDWAYDETRYWPAEGSIDFFAYSPAASRNVEKGLKNFKGSTTKIKYTVPQVSETNAQEDFLVARLRDQNGKANSKVTLTFHHTLSRILFSARTTKPGVTYLINSLSLLNVNQTGELDMLSDDFTESGPINYTNKVTGWEGQSNPADIAVDLSKSPIYVTSGTDYTPILGTTNALMVMPQATTLGASSSGSDGNFYIKLSYKAFVGDTYYAGGPNQSAIKYIPVKDPIVAAKGITFEMGRQYNFFLTFGDEVGEAMSFDVTVGDWTDTTPQYVPELDDYSSLISSSFKDAAYDAGGNKALSGLTKITKADLLKVVRIESGSNSFDFTGIEYFENLEVINLNNGFGGNTVNLDASKNAKLKELNLNENVTLGTVNLSNTAVKKIYCTQDGQKTIANLIAANTPLKQYGYENNEIRLNEPTVTGTLNLSNCGLTTIDRMPNNAAPKELILSNNNFTTFTIPDGYSTTKLDLSNNKLTTLTVPAKATSRFDIGELNLSNNNFKKLVFQHCKITTLNVSNNAVLTDLEFEAAATSNNTVIDKVDASRNSALQNITFSDGGVTSNILIKELDMRDSRNFTKVDVRFSKIEELIVWAGCEWDEIKDKLKRASGGGSIKGEITHVYEAGKLEEIGGI